MQLSFASYSRSFRNTLISLMFALMVSSAYADAPLRIATWNLEHLNETSDSGCTPRGDADYEKLKQRITDLNSDVVAIQEVESAKAAYRVFPQEEWMVVMSGRKTEGKRNACWEGPNQFLKHQGTGFAIRKGVSFQENPSFSSIADGNPDMRWGTDITINTEPSMRMLSVHLASGCWRKAQDADDSRREVCTNLNYQVIEIGKWIAARNQDEQNYVVLGDFNRALALEADWAWQTLSMVSPPPILATKPVVTQCNPRFDSIIDHIIVSVGLEKRLVTESLKEIPRIGDHPDHCAFSIDVRIGEN